MKWHILLARNPQSQRNTDNSPSSTTIATTRVLKPALCQHHSCPWRYGDERADELLALMELTQVGMGGWGKQTTRQGTAVSRPQEKLYSAEEAKYLIHEMFQEKLLCARPQSGSDYKGPSALS